MKSKAKDVMENNQSKKYLGTVSLTDEELEDMFDDEFLDLIEET